MPGRLKVRLLAARDLPVMDRASDSTDAFAEVRFDGEMFKTEVCKKSLNPQWNSEWFKFESPHLETCLLCSKVDDEVLQDEPLDIRVLDYDTYSAHDAIGKVYIDLTPLLSNDLPYVISGWFPIYDTMHGIRGELNIQVKVELFNDLNKFRQSSCGVHFFCTAAVPSGFWLQGVQGFVEELVVNDDPEYQLIDKIRTSRASNEARQRLFSKLSGGLQRKIGVKVLEMGGNAVLGYTQNFDLEGESGIVVRAIGTAVNLARSVIGQFSPSSASPSVYKDLHGSSQTNISHPHNHHHHHPSHHHHHHHHHHHQSRRRRNSQGHHRSMTGLATSPPLTSTMLIRSLGTSPPPSAPPMFSSSSPGFVFGSFEDRGFLGCQVAGEGQKQVQGRVVRSESEEQGVAFPSSSPFPEDSGNAGSPPLMVAQRHSVSPVRTTGVTSANSGSNRRLSESETGSPPGGLSLADSGSGINLTTTTATTTTATTATATTAVSVAGIRLTPPRYNINQQNINFLEFPFFTMRSFPSGFILSLGSMVSARSVKLLDKIHNPEEPETRDMWWSEIRTEIRSHMRSMNCHAVLGYVEQTSICDEIIILSASGTAARITFDWDQSSQGTQPPPTQVPSAPVAGPGEPAAGGEREKDKERRLTVDIGLANEMAQVKLNLNAVAANTEVEEAADKCSLCHIPYLANSLPFTVNLTKCAMCRKKKVPDVLFTTIDPPRQIPLLSHGALIQARVCRSKSKGKGSETSAREVSDSLPFLEYELHSQLLNKLKLRGLNAIFGLKIQVCLGENMIAALATGTAVFLAPMPQPPVPKLSTQVQLASEEETKDLAELQARITGIVQQHRERLHTEMAGVDETPQDRSPFGIPTDDSDEDPSDGETFFSNKDTFVLEIDDPKDEILSLILRDPVPPEGFEMCNTQLPPGIPSARITSHTQMFTQMAQLRFLPHINTKLEFADIFDMLLRRICFKLRRLAPCCLTDLNFSMEIPDEDEVQVAVTGCCLSLGEPPSHSSTLLALPSSATPSSGRLSPRLTVGGGSGGTGSEDMMFPMDVEGEKDIPSAAASRSQLAQPPAPGGKGNKVEEKRKIQSSTPAKTVGVELTPLPTVVGGTIIKYLGNYNFFLIRESTSVKECGGLGGFMQSFVGEVMAIARGHVSALGGNALVSYQMSHCVLFSNMHKNQAQCLINVCGDAVQISYGSDPLSMELPAMTDLS